jgi:predicted alpha-1,6-mannanase (GH76 family)
MQQSFFDPGRDGYLETPGGAQDARAWPWSQALAATLAMARLAQTEGSASRAARGQLAELRRRLLSGSVFSASPGGDVYWDDNEWIAFDLLDSDAQHDDPTARAEASTIFAAVTRAWDSDAAKPCAGGVRWTNATGNDDRNTVSTANGAVLGLRLYALTDKPQLLRRSERMLSWLDECMLAPNGLFWDHINGAGQVDRTEWSYNQGAVIGAYLLLYETTGRRSALTRAEAVADAALPYLAPRWQSEPPEFAAIFFRYLLQLAAAGRRRDYVAAARSYADRQWSSARDPRTGLFSSGGPPRLLAQAAFVQLYAALALASPTRATESGAAQ